jgi:hypothetical protein
VPLLRAGGDYKKVILSPLPRYVKVCCEDGGHLTNRKADDFKSKLIDGLDEIWRSLNDLIAGKKIRSFKVLSPMKLIDEEQDTADWVKNRKRFWSTDPVHMTADGYSELVRLLTAAAVEASYDRAATDSTPQQQPKSIPRVFNRQGWTKADDNTAHRVYNNLWSWISRKRSSQGRLAARRSHAPTWPHRIPAQTLLIIAYWTIL